MKYLPLLLILLLTSCESSKSSTQDVHRVHIPAYSYEFMEGATEDSINLVADDGVNDDMPYLDFETEEEANTITTNVHNGGEGLCGVYSKEIAESKVQASLEFSKLNKQPLRTVMKKV